MDFIDLIYEPVGVMEDALRNDSSLAAYSRDEKGNNALHHVFFSYTDNVNVEQVFCIRRDTMRLLLEHGIDINEANDAGITPIYVAIYHRHDVRLIQFMINNGAYVTSNMLITCCEKHYDDYGLQVISLLLNTITDNDKLDKALDMACRHNTVHVVKQLVEHGGARPTEKALQWACKNSVYGPDIIKYFASLPQINVCSANIKVIASAEIFRTLVSCGRTVSSLWQTKCPTNNYGNVLDILQEKKYPDVTRRHITLFKNVAKTKTVAWPCLRFGNLPVLDGSPNDWFDVMRGSRDAALWMQFCADMTMAGCSRHPQTGNTLLHLAALTGFVPALRAAMRFNAHPWFCNIHGHTAADLLPVNADAQCKHLLQLYETWRPERAEAFAWWCGPSFVARMHTLMHLCRIHCVPRDVRILLVQYLCKTEVTFCRLNH